MAWNASDAIKHAEDNAMSMNDYLAAQKNGRAGRCAGHVKKALSAGGVQIECVHARNCGGGLIAQGFTAVMDQRTDTGVYEKGDVLVIEGWADPDGDGPKKGNPSGHMAIWNGKLWISDFMQSKDVYPGPGYRTNKPAYVIYRNVGN